MSTQEPTAFPDDGAMDVKAASDLQENLIKDQNLLSLLTSDLGRISQSALGLYHAPHALLQLVQFEPRSRAILGYLSPLLTSRDMRSHLYAMISGARLALLFNEAHPLATTHYHPDQHHR